MLGQVVVTRSSSPRALDPDVLGALAAEVFGGDRVVVVPRLADAIAEAVSIAEEQGSLGSAGVVVTGSVVTAGEARAMLSRDA